MWSCIICQDSLSEKPEPIGASGGVTEGHGGIVTTACGHLFHKSCILEWITTSGGRDCAFCKQKISAATLIKIFPVSTQADASVNLGASSRGRQGQSQSQGHDGHCPSPKLKKQLDSLKSELDQYRKLSEETGGEAQHYRSAYESLLGQVYGDKNDGADDHGDHGRRVSLVEGLSSAEVKCILADQEKEITRLREYSNYKDKILKTFKERLDGLGVRMNLPGSHQHGFCDVTFT